MDNTIYMGDSVIFENRHEKDFKLLLEYILDEYENENLISYIISNINKTFKVSLVAGKDLIFLDDDVIGDIAFKDTDLIKLED